MDDLVNMQTGVMGYKGKIIYSVTGDINKELAEWGTIMNKMNYYAYR